MKTNILRMKRALRAALLVLLLIVVGMGEGYAQEFWTLGLQYRVNEDGTSVTVIDNNYATTGDLNIPSTVTYNGSSYSVTAIGNRAFSGCKCKGNLTIPNSVTTIDDYAFSSCKCTGNLTIPNSVTVIGEHAFVSCSGFTGSLTIPNSVITLGSYAFYDCSGFTGSLTIPNSVTTLGDAAFYGCTGFTGSLTIPNSVTTIGGSAFYGCSGFTGSLIIPNSVTTIGGGVFYGCSGFTGSLTIPNSVTMIGGSAFKNCWGFTGILNIPNSVALIETEAFCNCEGITSINIPSSVTYIGLYAFNETGWYDRQGDGVLYLDGWCLGYKRQPTGALSIKNGTRYIADNAFRSCSKITSLTIPNSVTSIGTNAFYECGNITSVTIGDSNTSSGNTSIGYGAFAYCSSLKSVTLGNSVSTLDEGAFGRCSSLTSVTLPSSIHAIAKDAFFDCTDLNQVHYTGTEAQWCGIRFGNSMANPNYYAHNLYINNNLVTDLIISDSASFIGSYAFENYTKLNSVVIPNTVTSIGASAFFGCTGLTSIAIPNSVTSIGASAFSGCKGLTSIAIPNSVTSIGGKAFSGFSGTSITIPKSVAFIGNGAFGNCSRLSTVYYNAENATGSSAFSDCTNLTTVHIGADVKELHPVFGGCSNVHLVVAMGSTPAVLESNALTDIAENSILMVSCGKRLAYFSVWNMFEFTNILEDCGEYPIGIGNIGAGGNVSASTSQAQMGQEVQLTVSPNSGMALSSISVCNVSDPAQTIPVYPIGKGSSKYGFVMPPFGVSVSASFKTSGVSVGENDGVCVSVYPNPTNGPITIKAEDLKQVTISNMLGQIVYEGRADGYEFTYDFGSHEVGVYVVRIETANGVAVRKVSVTR